MPSRLPQFPFRTSKTNIKKLAYIAKTECRSTTKEIEYLIIKRIKEYEAENGEIILPDSDEE